MHTFLKRLTRLAPTPGRRAALALLALVLVVGPWTWLRAHGSPPSNAPQVLLLVTNSQSMGGTTAGAIMTGSGVLGSDRTTLQNTSSPVNYTIPAGFVPPLNSGSAGSAPYTVTCNTSQECDNGPSRMNLAKYAIQQVLNSYGNAVDFGIYTYNISSNAVYTTWLGYLSPTSGFSFTNTAAANTVANPCYNYSSAATQVKADCTAIDNAYTANIGAYQYVVVSDTTDDPLINTVLHASFSQSVIMWDSGSAGKYWYWANQTPGSCSNYGSATATASTSPPYTATDLGYYKSGTIYTCYEYTYGSGLSNGTQVAQYVTPSNAGYLPYMPQLLYAQRGFSEIANTVSATTGTVSVAMGTSPTAAAFTAALSPEVNDSTTSEIKPAARQSPVAGLLKGALGYLNGLTKASCQQQYVVLLTDGLPTLDLAGNKWPPAGSAAATGYGVTVGFNSDGTVNTSSSVTNDQAVLDTISQIQSLQSAGIQVYVIGLGAGVQASNNAVAQPLLQAMALAGGTSGYYPANNPTDLNNAFQAIVGQIYHQSSVAAPVVPVSVSNGSSDEYLLTTNPVPLYGSATAYAVASNGTPANSASWEAGSLMTTATRTSALMSTKSDGTTVAALSSIDTAAFSLTATTCVPNVTTLLNYTWNPSYTTSGCSYLAGRQSGSFLGGFSTQDSGRYLGPPSNSALVGDTSYVSFATGLSTRSPLLLFTNNDGFLYALNAGTGALQWAWTPRSTLAQLQNYSTFQSLTWMDGGFTTVDAKDGSGNWATYVVGSVRSGAEHFSLKLNSSAAPSAVVYDTVVAGGTSPGDKAVSTGSGASRQPPQVAWINGSAYALYVVNTGTSTVTSTLYEVNVATGASTSATLSFQPSSSLSFDTQASQLWMGSSAGGVYVMSITGSASTDVGTVYQIGSTTSPTSSSTTVTPVLYVGYTQVAGVPYVFAANPGMITVFTVGTGGWTPVWAATTTNGYTYASGSFSSSTSVDDLDDNAVISDQPLLVNGALVVPEWVAATGGCGLGSGYLAFFDLKVGKFPTTTLTWQGNPVTSNILVGSGAAFTPTVTVTTGSVALNTGTSGTLAPGAPMTTSGLLGPQVTGWRVVN